MRSPLNHDDFEDFLSRQANDYRMYPSDKLWRNIQVSIHGESRWPALTYISIIIIAALVTGTLLVKPEERLKENVAAYAAATTQAARQQAMHYKADAADNSPVQHAYTDKITRQTIENVTEQVEEEQLARTRASQQSNADMAAAIVTTTYAHAVPPSGTMLPLLKYPQLVAAHNAADNTVEEAKVEIDVAAPKRAPMYFNTFGLMNLSGLKGIGSKGNTISGIQSEDLWTSFPLRSTKDLLLKKLSKFTFQFYLTPSFSYRRLTDAKGKSARLYTAVPLSANYKIDLSKMVKHTPSAGAEVGFALGYRLSDRFTLKTGMQFNVRQYNIEAYTIEEPPTPMLLSLEAEASPAGLSASADAIATASQRASNNGRPMVLRNRYYEASAPVGIDYRVIGNNHNAVTFNIAASVQPTYTFDKEPFVLSTDYKNYTDGTSIMRNWNINSNLEAYLTYKLGPLRWQIGPQLRYQHLPTFGSGYPIHEHLIDYGLKIGFTKSLD